MDTSNSERTKRIEKLLHDPNVTTEDVADYSREELVEMLAELARCCSTDVLTEILNRRGFEQIVSPYLRRHERAGHEGVFCILDIDYFKQINDTHGHQCGDAVLHKVAKTITNTLRPQDVVGRWGGEEFAIWMPETQQDDGKKAAERVRAAVEEITVSCVDVGAEVNVTVSIGLTSTKAIGYEPEALTKASDEMLYSAKEGGRNQIRVSWE